MIAPEHQGLKLTDFYHTDFWRGNYDRLDIYKPIGEFSLTDLSWCLRRRQFTESVLEIIIDKIEDNQDEIGRYTTELGEWFHEVVKEVITIPFSFWDSRSKLYSRYSITITKLFKVKGLVENAVLQMFLAYKPQRKLIYWTEEDSHEFVMDHYYDTVGNLSHAIDVMKELNYALLNGHEVFIVSEFRKITTVQQLKEFLFEEYDFLEKENGAISDIVEEMEEVKKIKFIKGKAVHKSANILE